MGAIADAMLRKQMRSTKQDGFATYDAKRRQNTKGTPISRPVYPSGDDIGFSG